MTEVFLDTVGLIALWNSSDQWHKAAEAVYRTLLSQGKRLITTDLVLIECGNAAARRPYRSRSTYSASRSLNQGLLIKATDQDVDDAWAAYDRADAGQAGVVDQVSFVVMGRLGITEAFTNDRHFQAAGFHTLF